MIVLTALRHVSSAARHAEAFADEATDLGLTTLADRLRAAAATINAGLDRAMAAFDAVGPARDARRRAQHALQATYGEVTLRLEDALSPEEVSRLTPGGNVEVAERARYRLRELPHEGAVAIVEARQRLALALDVYDRATHAYLHACAVAQGRKDQVLVESQALRAELERAKATLLLRCEVNGETWRRIRRRCVRTKRARWLEEARAQRLLAQVSQTPPADEPTAIAA